MKKTIAIVLSLVMLFGLFAINTFAATGDPTVQLITNAGSPIKNDEHDSTVFTLKFNDFYTVQGMDVIVSLTGANFSEDGQGKPLFSVSGFDFSDKMALDSNYTYSKAGTEKKIHIVDLTGGKNGKIYFTITNIDNPEINVLGKYAKDGKTMFELENEGSVEIAVDPVDNTANAGQPIVPSAGKFIPYGSVWKGTGSNVSFANKDSNGSFDTSDGEYTYNEFNIPANGIVTFGVSDPIDKELQNALRFGNYFNKSLTGTTTFGTMIFEGDWLAVKELYIKNGYTVQEILKLFSNDYDTKKAANQNMNYVRYTVNGDDFRVYKFAQTKHLWKNGDVLEYAINITGVEEDQTYTAAAYFVNGETTTISETVKYEKV